jgi:hypothetical protein
MNYVKIFHGEAVFVRPWQSPLNMRLLRPGGLAVTDQLGMTDSTPDTL